MLANIEDRILRTVRELDQVPTLPVVVARLNQEIQNPNANASSIARIIEDDPPIMTRVLKLVNSVLYAPVFNYRRNITIDAAVVRLGMNTLRDLVISTSMLTLFPPRGKVSFDRNEFWRHCICCGLVAETVAKFAQVELAYDESEIVLSGLCHDIGKVIVDQYFHDEFVDVLNVAQKESLLFYEAEQKLLHIEHGQIGGELAVRWKLPESITMAISYHHRPKSLVKKEHRPLVELIGLADYICNHQSLGFSGNYRTMEFPREAFESLKLDVKDIPAIIERVQAEAKKSEIFLSLAA